MYIVSNYDMRDTGVNDTIFLTNVEWPKFLYAGI